MSLDGFLQGLGVYIPGKVHRTLAVDGVPPGRIGTAEELHFQTDTHGRVFNRITDNF